MRGGTNLTAAPSLPASQTRALVGLWALAEVGGGHLGSVRPMPVQTPCTFPRGIAIELPGRWVGGMRWGCNGSCMQPCHRPAQNIRLSCFLLVRLLFFLLSACFVHCISEYKAMKSFAPCLAETTAQRPALDVGLRYLRLPVLVGAAHLLR